MMTFSVVWVVLAATVIVIAMLRRAGASHHQAEVQVRQSGRALTVVAVIYSLVLLAGFLYIGWQHGLELMK
jgi:heme/copper-type cytochrome/quinol oxidase subunit 2